MVVAYEAIVENGRLQLPEGVVVPDKTTVYVVVPEMRLKSTAHLRSPHLFDPAQAIRFELEVIKKAADAGPPIPNP